MIEGTVWPDHTAEVKEQIRAIFRTKTRDEWTEIFKGADACVQPVLNLEEALLQDEQIRAREMVVEVGMPLQEDDQPLQEDVKVKQMATAIKLSETPCEYRHAGYPPGYHTREIIESLGLDYESLEEKGVFD